MKNTLIFLILALLSWSHPGAIELDTELDSNTAFYEGEFFNYVIPAPDKFKMATVEAQKDGYSFAFIPRDGNYENSDIMIGVHIYKIRGMSFAEALTGDTSSVRAYFGADLQLYPVDSLFNASGDRLTSFYLNQKKAFIPNVMLSYYDGRSELIIFELVISEKVIRVTAEEIFVKCIESFKSLRKGELGKR